MVKANSQVARPKDKKMELTAQRTVFALETMEEVTLVKKTEFVPVETAKDALDRLGNDPKKFLEVINDGLATITRKSLVSDNSIAWQQEDEAGKLTPFSGTVADAKMVNSLQLNLAKTVFGYSKDLDIVAKRAAKDSALEMIRTTPAIVAGLQKNAAAE